MTINNNGKGSLPIKHQRADTMKDLKSNVDEALAILQVYPNLCIFSLIVLYL
jgi:hypothetical protein